MKQTGQKTGSSTTSSPSKDAKRAESSDGEPENMGEKTPTVPTDSTDNHPKQEQKKEPLNKDVPQHNEGSEEMIERRKRKLPLKNGESETTSPKKVKKEATKGTNAESASQKRKKGEQEELIVPEECKVKDQEKTKSRAKMTNSDKEDSSTRRITRSRAKLAANSDESKESDESRDSESKTAAPPRKKVRSNATKPTFSGRHNSTSPKHAVKKDDKAASPIKEGTETPETGKGVLEKGHIFFLYRPRVAVEEVESIDDVARLYMILDPKDKKGKEDHKVRLIIVARKKLPEIHDRARYWGFVQKLADTAEEVGEKYLGEETYDTKTRGQRHIGAARPCGEGVYSILEHDGHTHLAYVLEMPEQPGEVQAAFNIEKQASFIVTVKNPEEPSPPWAGLSENSKAQFPPEYQDLFGGKRKKSLKFIPLNPTSLLDFEHTEIVLIGAGSDVVAEHGKLGEELEEWEKDEHHTIKNLEDVKLFDQLKLDHDIKLEPLQGNFA